MLSLLKHGKGEIIIFGEEMKPNALHIKKALADIKEMYFGNK